MMSPECRRAVELGAVSGVFSPEDMGAALGLDNASPIYRAALWRDLSEFVTEVLEPDYGWKLKPDARLAVLTRLVSHTQVRQLIEDAPRTQKHDSFAAFLHDLLSGNHVAVESSRYRRNQENDVLAEMRRAGILLDAAQFAQQSPAVDADALANITSEVKRHIAELRQRRDLLIVLPRRHFGYEAERRTLSHFLRSVGQDGDPRPMFLSGTGGVGKSALHARLFRYWQQRCDGPLTVTLDFDRRQLNSGSPIELLKEFLRQCAVGVFEKGFPTRIAKEIGDGLKAMRYGLANISTDSSFDRQMSDIASSQLAGFQENWAAPLRYQSIAVVFDSFEALDRRGGRNVEIVLRLEELLRLSLPRVRSVFAGREEPLEPIHMASRFGEPDRRLRLQGVTPVAGAQLIKEEDSQLAGLDGKSLIVEDNHERIVEILKGHPLAILMLVQFAHARPDEIDRLLSDLGQENGQFEAEFAQVFLYERILDRITNPEVRALAHPGLVLRQLNTDLIREVLTVQRQERGIMAPVTEAEAEKLKDALEREYWLVEPDDQGFDLRHRPDLRRLMLPGLFANPRDDDSTAQREKKESLKASALAVCRLAAHYFREGPTEDQTAARHRWNAFPERLRMAHGFYYTSFVMAPTSGEITVEQARDIDLELGEDLETMPLEWRALIKALLDHEVSIEEQNTLDEDLYEAVESSVFMEESKVGRSMKQRIIPSKTGNITSSLTTETRTSAARLERQIADAFAQARFERITDLADPYLRALNNDDGTAERRFDELAQKDITHTPLWKVLLVAATNEFGFPDIEPNFTSNQNFSFSALQQAITMVGKSGIENQDVVQKLELYIGDENSPHSYRQHVFQLFDPGNKLLSIPGASFAMLALAAHPIEREIWPDHRQLYSVDFLESAVTVFSKPQLKAREIQDVYNAAKIARFEITAALFSGPHSLHFNRLLRGLTPELYEPLITGLRRADSAAIICLEKLIKKSADNWPADLRINAKLIDETAPLIVEMADRFGLLNRMAQELAVGQPEIQRVVEMHNVLTDWFFPNLFGLAQGPVNT